MHLHESQKKEDTLAPNVRAVAKCFFFAILCVWGQSKSRPVKAAGAEPEEKSKIARRCGREAHLDVKMLQLRSRNTF